MPAPPASAPASPSPASPSATLLRFSISLSSPSCCDTRRCLRLSMRTGCEAVATASHPVRMLRRRHRRVSQHEGELREMLNRKSVALGLAGLGLAGALAGGAGIAAAATGATTTTPTTASTVATPPYRDGGMSGMASGMSGMASGVNSPITAAASYLGLSRTDLQTQLQAGKSLADVAQAQGKSVSGLEGAMVTAIKSNLDANTTLTADQKAAILAQVKSHIDTMVNTTHPSGAGIGSMGARMSGMRR